jgi:hypothetical protein
VFRCYKVDVVASPSLLQFDIPFAEFFRSQVKTFALVSNVVVLAKGATQITATEEDGAASIVPLKTRFCELSVPHAQLTYVVTRPVSPTLSKVRCDCVDLYRLGTNQTHARLFIPIHTA